MTEKVRSLGVGASAPTSHVRLAKGLACERLGLFGQSRCSSCCFRPGNRGLKPRRALNPRRPDLWGGVLQERCFRGRRGRGKNLQNCLVVLCRPGIEYLCRERHSCGLRQNIHCAANRGRTLVGATRYPAGCHSRAPRVLTLPGGCLFRRLAFSRGVQLPLAMCCAQVSGATPQAVGYPRRCQHRCPEQQHSEQTHPRADNSSRSGRQRMRPFHAIELGS
jgi:hypothetical protein